MRITLTPTNGSPVILGDDDSADFITGDLPEQARDSQVNRPMRATHVNAVARLRRANSLTWQVERIHTSAGAAKKFKYHHAEDVPAEGLLEITEPADFALWIANAVITEVRCVLQHGITTKFQYRALGGEILTANPNT